jgi:hypothetical protein
MPCIPAQAHRRFAGTYYIYLQDRILARNKKKEKLVAYSTTLKKKAACSSETSVNSYRTTWRYIPEDITLHSDLCENPNCGMLSFY